MGRGWISAVEKQASDNQTTQTAYGVQSFSCSAASRSSLGANGLACTDHHFHQVSRLRPRAAMPRLLHLPSSSAHEQIYLAA